MGFLFHKKKPAILPASDEKDTADLLANVSENEDIPPSFSPESEDLTPEPIDESAFTEPTDLPPDVSAAKKDIDEIPPETLAGIAETPPAPPKAETSGAPEGEAADTPAETSGEGSVEPPVTEPSDEKVGEAPLTGTSDETSGETPLPEPSDQEAAELPAGRDQKKKSRARSSGKRPPAVGMPVLTPAPSLVPLSPEDTVRDLERREPTAGETAFLRVIRETALITLPDPARAVFGAAAMRTAYGRFHQRMTEKGKMPPTILRLAYGATANLAEDDMLPLISYTDESGAVFRYEWKSAHSRQAATLSCAKNEPSLALPSRKKDPDALPRVRRAAPSAGDLMVRVTLSKSVKSVGVSTLLERFTSNIVASSALCYPVPVTSHPWRDILSVWDRGINFEAGAFDVITEPAILTIFPPELLPSLRKSTASGGLVYTPVGTLTTNGRIVRFGTSETAIDLSVETVRRVGCLPMENFTVPAPTPVKMPRIRSLRSSFPGVAAGLTEPPAFKVIEADEKIRLFLSEGTEAAYLDDPFFCAYYLTLECVARLLAAGLPFRQTVLLPSRVDVCEDAPTPNEVRCALGRHMAELALGIGTLGVLPPVGELTDRVRAIAAVADPAFTPIPDHLAAPGHTLIWLRPSLDRDGLPTPESLRTVFGHVSLLIRSHLVASATVLGAGGIAEGLLSLCRKGTIGVKLNLATPVPTLFLPAHASFLLELTVPTPGIGQVIGVTSAQPSIEHAMDSLPLSVLLHHEAPEDPPAETPEAPQTSLSSPSESAPDAPADPSPTDDHIFPSDEDGAERTTS